MRSSSVQRTSSTCISQNWAWMGSLICSHLFSQVRSVHHGMELDTKQATIAMSCVFLACFGVLIVCYSQVSSTESDHGSQFSCLVSLGKYLCLWMDSGGAQRLFHFGEISDKSVGKHDLPSLEALLYLSLLHCKNHHCSHAGKHVSLTLAKAHTHQAPR